MIHSRDGHSPCSNGVAITELVSRSRPKMHVSRGRCWPKTPSPPDRGGELPIHRKGDPYALHQLSKQVRPALAEPDRPPSGNRCLMIEARARGLHTGPNAWHSSAAD